VARAPKRRMRWAIAMLVAGVVVAFVPAIAAGERFLDPYSPLVSLGPWHRPPFNIHSGLIPDGLIVKFPPPSLVELVQTDAAWAIAAATLLASPMLFLWWRRSAIGFGRVTGVACCVAAAAAACVLVIHRWDSGYVKPGWIWTAVPLGGALMAASFLVAPAPQVRDE
jgi:hypothetical protein